MSFANRRPIDTIDRRVGLLFGIFLLLMLIAAARATYLGVFRGPALKQMAALEQVQDLAVPAERRASVRASRREPVRCRHGTAPASRHSRPRATFSRTGRESNSSIRWNVRPRPIRARCWAERAVTS